MTSRNARHPFFQRCCLRSFYDETIDQSIMPRRPVPHAATEFSVNEPLLCDVIHEQGGGLFGSPLQWPPPPNQMSPGQSKRPVSRSFVMVRFTPVLRVLVCL